MQVFLRTRVTNTRLELSLISVKDWTWYMHPNPVLTLFISCGLWLCSIAADLLVCWFHLYIYYIYTLLYCLQPYLDVVSLIVGLNHDTWCMVLSCIHLLPFCAKYVYVTWFFSLYIAMSATCFTCHLDISCISCTCLSPSKVKPYFHHACH